MNYIRIKNDGLIESEALHLVGASTKVNDHSKIGQFGSGNKYALAYLLRNGYELKIFAGLKEIKITTENSTFRDQDFDVVHIDGVKTSITTQMGKDWKLWQSVREIYCNALDEGNPGIEYVETIEPSENETHFYISSSMQIDSFMKDFDSYFTTKKTLLFECDLGRIYTHSGETANVYRKGIRCYDSDYNSLFDSEYNSLFDYDFNEIDINESRVVTSYWHVHRAIWQIIMKCTRKDVIRRILQNSCNAKMIECNVYDIYSAVDGISKEFEEVLLELKLVPEGYAGMLSNEELAGCTIIPTKLYHGLSDILNDQNKASLFKSVDDKGFYKEFDPNPLQEATIAKVLDFFKECSFEIPYDIITAKFESKKILGAAIDGKIYITDVCLTRGVNEIANCVIEEFIHLKYEVADETRRFQDSIIGEFVDYMKMKNLYII